MFSCSTAVINSDYKTIYLPYSMFPEPLTVHSAFFELPALYFVDEQEQPHLKQPSFPLEVAYAFPPEHIQAIGISLPPSNISLTSLPNGFTSFILISIPFALLKAQNVMKMFP